VENGLRVWAVWKRTRAVCPSVSGVAKSSGLSSRIWSLRRSCSALSEPMTCGRPLAAWGIMRSGARLSRWMAKHGDVVAVVVEPDLAAVNQYAEFEPAVLSHRRRPMHIWPSRTCLSTPPGSRPWVIRMPTIPGHLKQWRRHVA
jgi:hypothetical protein